MAQSASYIRTIGTVVNEPPVRIRRRQNDHGYFVWTQTNVDEMRIVFVVALVVVTLPDRVSAEEPSATPTSGLLCVGPDAESVRHCEEDFALLRESGKPPGPPECQYLPTKFRIGKGRWLHPGKDHWQCVVVPLRVPIAVVYEPVGAVRVTITDACASRRWDVSRGWYENLQEGCSKRDPKHDEIVNDYPVTRAPKRR